MFLNSFCTCILLYVVTPPKPYTPRLIHAGSWSLKISFSLPPGADTSKTIIFLVEYRQHQQTAWQSLPETQHTTVTITNLDANMLYVIRVAAKYEGGVLGEPSNNLEAHTKPGKCCFKRCPR